MKMDNEFAKQIVTEYVFSEYKIESIYKFINVNIQDGSDKKLYAEALLTKALQKSVIALNNPSKSEVIKDCITKIKQYTMSAYDWDMVAKMDEGNEGYIQEGLYEAVEILQQLI